MKLSRIGIDLAKNVFQIHGVDRHGKTMWKRRLKRNQWLQAVSDKAGRLCDGYGSVCWCASLGS